MTLTVAPHRLQRPEPREAFHQWTLPDGTTWTEIFRIPGGYMVRFPDLADFEVSEDGRNATAHPMPEVAESTLEHLYLNQVKPQMLSKQGQLVFHASAVSLEVGAVAFAAASGRGKSTLAASFAISGNALLTDDGLILQPTTDHYNVLPSHPSIRLWADSSDALIPPSNATTSPPCYSSKSRFLAGEQVRFCAKSRPLRHVYFLGEGFVNSVSFERLTPSQALIEWVKHSFLLDIEEQPRLASHFNQVANLADMPIHYRLDYPRRYEALAEVRNAIIQHAGLGGGGSSRQHYE